jgi:hypothetical protein
LSHANRSRFFSPLISYIIALFATRWRQGNRTDQSIEQNRASQAGSKANPGSDRWVKNCRNSSLTRTSCNGCPKSSSRNSYTQRISRVAEVTDGKRTREARNEGRKVVGRNGNDRLHSLRRLTGPPSFEKELVDQRDDDLITRYSLQDFVHVPHPPDIALLERIGRTSYRRP